MDIIWDVYKSGSLKEHARYRSGNYIRVFVVMWSSTWLCQKYAIASFGVTRKKGVIHILEPCVGGKQAGHRHVQRRSGTVIPRNFVDASPCRHEDGDTRMIFHVGDAANNSPCW